jgi:hypothetical protein
MGFWTNTIEKITAGVPNEGRFYILSTEYDYSDHEVSDICEPGASYGMTFATEFEARMFAGQHSIALECDAEFEDSCQREVTLRRDGMTEAQMVSYVRSLGPTRLRSEARLNPFAYDESLRRARRLRADAAVCGVIGYPAQPPFV